VLPSDGKGVEIVKDSGEQRDFTFGSSVVSLDSLDLVARAPAVDFMSLVVVGLAGFVAPRSDRSY
jgi:hypothetical protein